MTFFFAKLKKKKKKKNPKTALRTLPPPPNLAVAALEVAGHGNHHCPIYTTLDIQANPTIPLNPINYQKNPTDLESMNNPIHLVPTIPKLIFFNKLTRKIEI